MFERSGHGPFMDEPDRFFSILRNFVQALPGTKTVEIAAWKKSVEERVADRPRRLSDEAAGASDRITFQTRQSAPTEFDGWTFFWLFPTVAEGARIGYEVRTDQGELWYRLALRPGNPGQNVRSDFRPGFPQDQGAPRKLDGKNIIVRFWTSQGKIEFPAGMKLTFEFTRTGCR